MPIASQRTFSPLQNNIVPFFSNLATNNAPVEGPQQPARQPQDNVSLSSSALALAPATNNPYGDIGATSSQVKVDAWGQGKNDCLEHILTNQGYSLSDIYKKDAQGKCLLDRVSAVNNLKNPNLIHPGQKLQIPSKMERAEEAMSVGYSALSGRLQQSSDVPSGRLGEHTMEDRSGTHTTNGSIQSADGSAQTHYTSTSGAHNSMARFSDTDGNASMRVIATGNELYIRNSGSNGDNTITSKVDLAESAQDGFFENKARSFAEFFGYQKEVVDNGVAENASDVRVYRNDDGSTKVYASVDGDESKPMLSLAGDTDDSWLEQAGEGADKAASFLKGLFN